jgi:sugar-specific transcriptional regulator TrmB
MSEKTDEALRKLGLSSYEAQSYMALLELGPSNGYTVAKHSGVPSSKVYQALASLAAKGFADTDGMEEGFYAPAEPSAALSGIKKEINENIDSLLPALERAGRQSAPLKARKISGEKAALALLSKLIMDSEKKLLVTAWPRDLKKIEGDIRKAAKTRDVHILSYGPFDAGGASLYVHRRTDLVREEIPGRMLLAANDTGQGIILSYGTDDKPEGIWADSPGISGIVADHILHDISLNFLMSKIPDSKKYEDELTALRARLYL